MVNDLKTYLSKKFGDKLNITTYHSGKLALNSINKNTDLVILDYYADGEIGHEMMNIIKGLNPKTAFILLSNNKDIEFAIDSFQNTNNALVISNDLAKYKIISLVQNLFTYPIRLLVREFRVSKYLAIFLMSFLTMLLAVVIALYFILT